MDNRQYAINFAHRNCTMAEYVPDGGHWCYQWNTFGNFVYGNDPFNQVPPDAEICLKKDEITAINSARYNWIAMATLIYSNLKMRMNFWHDNFTPHRRLKMPLEKVFDETIEKWIEPRLEGRTDGQFAYLHFYNDKGAEQWRK